MDSYTIKEKLSDFFETREEVLLAYLFGSVVKGTSIPIDDIDSWHWGEGTWRLDGMLN